jgi:hypothetical protein
LQRRTREGLDQLATARRLSRRAFGSPPSRSGGAATGPPRVIAIENPVDLTGVLTGVRIGIRGWLSRII